MSTSCQNQYCYNYEAGTFYCNCRLCDRNSSAAFLGLCQTKQKYDRSEVANQNVIIKLEDEMNCLVGADPNVV